MEEDIKTIKEVLATLISWAAAEGMGYNTATELLTKLYSGCEDEGEVRQ